MILALLGWLAFFTTLALTLRFFVLVLVLLVLLKLLVLLVMLVPVLPDGVTTDDAVARPAASPPPPPLDAVSPAAPPLSPPPSSVAISPTTLGESGTGSSFLTTGMARRHGWSEPALKRWCCASPAAHTWSSPQLGQRKRLSSGAEAPGMADAYSAAASARRSPSTAGGLMRHTRTTLA